jgi:hypothetical protein
MKYNDYPIREYIEGAIPTMEVLSPCLQGEDIVYSPTKYRETEGIKRAVELMFQNLLQKEPKYIMQQIPLVVVPLSWTSFPTLLVSLDKMEEEEHL